MKRIFLLLLAVTAVAPLFAQNDHFAFNFFERMQELDNHNVLISPLSIKQAIGLAANSAQNETLSEILSLSDDESLGALNLRNQQEASVAIRHQYDTLSGVKLANSVWYKPEMITLSDAYRDSLINRYAAEIRAADFGTQAGVDSLNAWVSRQTNGLIPKLMESPDAYKLLSLVNAVYFKGTWWDEMFPAGNQAFRNADGSGTNVEMMQYGKADDNLYYQKDFIAFKKDFVSADEDEYLSYSMYFVMPRDPEHISNLTESVWQELLSNRITAELHVKMPKFDIGCNADIKPVLQDMGAFIHNQYADFEEVNKINHITRLKVDEKGAEAAAVTEIIVSAGIAEPQPIIDIEVDRPFYVVIKDRKMADPLFMGRVNFIKGENCEAPVAKIFSDIENVRSASPEKIMQNGQLIIRKDGKDYSVTGQLIRR